MAARSARGSVATNGDFGRRPLIEKADVKRFVAEVERNPKGEFVDAKIQVHFKVNAGEARTVSVAGTFNGWEPKGTRLTKRGDEWDATIALPRGRYEYKFIVDGQWMPDPSAPESVANPFGSQNSVLTV